MTSSTGRSSTEMTNETDVPRDFLLPDLGEGLEDAEIVAWLVQVGDEIELNQDILEVQTAKASVVIPSPYEGTVVETFGAPGDVILVGKPLCRIAPPEAKPKVLVGYGTSSGEVATKRRRRRVLPPDAGMGLPVESEVTAQRRPLAKPPVRRLARDRSVDLAALSPGSGAGGSITREDVLKATGSVEIAESEPPEPAKPTGLTIEGSSPGFRGRSAGEVEVVRGARRTVIRKMMAAHEIPTARCAQSVDCTALLQLADSLKKRAAAGKSAVRIGPFALMVHATILGLGRFPTLNATIDSAGTEIHLLPEINLGFAIDTEQGLLVPNVKDAQAMTTYELARELERLKRAAHNGSLTTAELTGGTFTVTNYGVFGNDDGTPVINPPEAGILGIGAIKPRPWVVNDELVARPVATLSLVFDHRINDGGEAGRFMAAVCMTIEDPGGLELGIRGASRSNS